MLVLLIERFLGENLGNNDTIPARYLGSSSQRSRRAHYIGK